MTNLKTFLHYGERTNLMPDLFFSVKIPQRLYCYYGILLDPEKGHNLFTSIIGHLFNTIIVASTKLTWD